MTCQACNIAKYEGPTTLSESACYHNMLWAKGPAIALHPHNYDGLTKDSTLEEFQALLSKRRYPKTGKHICENPYDCHRGTYQGNVSRGGQSKRNSQVRGRAQDSHVKAQLCDALKAVMQRRNIFEIEAVLRRATAFLEKSKPYSKQRRSKPNDLDDVVMDARVLLEKLRLQAKKHDISSGRGSTNSGLGSFFRSDSTADAADRVGMTGSESDNKSGTPQATKKRS